MANNKNALAKEYKGKNKLSNILMAISVILGIIPMFIIMKMIGLLSDKKITINTILMFAVGICLCQILKAIFYALAIWKAHDSAYSSLAEIRLNLIDHLKKMSFGFFQKRKVGDLTNIINHDVEQIELYLAHALPEIIVTNLIPLIIFIILLIVDWRLALALISTVPFMFLLRSFLNKFLGGTIEHFNKSTKKMSEDLLEYIATIPVIKAFSKEEKKTQNVLNGMHEYISWVKKATASISIPMSFVIMLLEGGLVILVIVGSLLLSNQQIDLQKFILAIILGKLFSDAFVKMPTFQHYDIIFKKSVNSINSVLGVQPYERSKKYQGLEAGDIEFKAVDFSYDGEENVLENINLVFKKNSVNAIVGSSGSGKSTIANLLMGFWRVDSGVITINGEKIDEISERDLSSLVSIVQQEVFLFNMSLEENIKIGKKDASREEVIEAAKKAQIHDMIINLPQGYETIVGEAGVKLSGGEKQRISIARMILKNAPIIILDEATAAIDTYNEYLIQKAISNLGEKKTIIMIAHHLDTIVNVDQIVVMEDRKIVDRGTHEDLFKTCDLYKKMLKEQANVDSWKIKEVAEIC